VLQVLHEGRQLEVKKLLFSPERDIFEVDKNGNLITHKSFLSFQYSGAAVLVPTRLLSLDHDVKRRH